MATQGEGSNDDAAAVETQPLETWTIAQPDPRGGRTQRGEVRGLLAWTFNVLPEAGDLIERTLRIHNTGTLRSHATVWRERREIQGQRSTPDDVSTAEVEPAAPGDARAIVIRQEVDLLDERRRGLRRDVESLEGRRDSLVREIDSLVERHTKDVGRLSGMLEMVITQHNRTLSHQLGHNAILIEQANDHAGRQLRGAWELEAAQATQRTQVTKEVATQATEIGAIRQQLHGSLLTDRLGDILREGRAAFKDALHSPLGEAFQLRVASEIQRELKSEGQEVTRAQVLDAMLFQSSGYRLRLDVLRKLATARADDPTAQALAFGGSWLAGDLGDDPQCVNDFITARAK